MDEDVQGEASGRERKLGEWHPSQIHPKFTCSKLCWKRKADVPKAVGRLGLGDPRLPPGEQRQGAAGTQRHGPGRFYGLAAESSSS